MQLIKFHTDLAYPCECCGASNAQRSGLCFTCEDAERHVLMAEMCDVDAALSDDDVNAFAAEQSRPSIAPFAPEAA